MAKTLIALQSKDPIFDQVFKISWFIGRLCNFSCTYCAEYARSGFAKRDDILRGTDLLRRKIVGQTPHLMFAGGEPSIHPDIYEVTQYMDQLGFHVGMTTNGSRPAADYVDLLRIMRYFTFSLHFDQKYERTLDAIFKVQEAIRAAPAEYPGRFVHVHVMMVPGYFDRIMDVIQTFKDRNISFIIRRIRPLLDKNQMPILPAIIKDRAVRSAEHDPMDSQQDDWGYYSAEELETLRSFVLNQKQNTEEIWRDDEGQYHHSFSNANDVSLRKINRFRGWTCNIGLQRIQIDNKGDIYRSTCKVGGLLGNIYTDFELPTQPIICKRDVCTDAWAINIPKASDDQSAARLRRPISVLNETRVY